ncbi:ABC transporter ATP-binding protein [Lewinella sp. IMCC34183]|uniref:ABC transporter ATP-binding protein n=1 Tax=Lewinella sp. IMCC34183 TaxID=2248762 RepID=UPI0018E59E2A|nr:ABC transporter ATP-binding protein [Lewinella sp. IMCC34183]
MFLPLLKVAGTDQNGGVVTESMGDMAIVLDALGQLGIDLTLLNILVVMFGFFVLKGIAKFMADFYRVILQQRFANRLRIENMSLLAGYDYQAFAKSNSGRIQNTFSGEVNRVHNAYKAYFTMLQQAIMTMVYVFLAYSANPRFALIVAGGGVISNLAFSRIYGITKDASRQMTLRMHGFQQFLIQSVTSFKFLKATDLITPYKKKIIKSIIGIEEQQRKVNTMSAISSAMREPIIILIVAAAILIQVEIFGESLGLIILSLLFFYRGLTSLVALQGNYNTFLSNLGALDNMQEFVAELKRDQETTGNRKLTTFNEGIVMKNLYYSYDDESVIEDLSVTIRKNSTVGLVGESGTGKTTLVNLFCGLLKPAPGMLFIDGIDVNELDVHSLRQRIGYVTQEPQVFTDSIFDNISFWEKRTPESEKKVWEALRLAHAADFVAALPQGLDTVIGINGVNLSGGQRQRISIARELYRDVDILILDEATSALDSQSEKAIQENIESLSGNYTIIVIAHRLSTIRKADKIVYLQPGGRYQVGTFDGLTEASETFQRMVALQSMA